MEASNAYLAVLCFGRWNEGSRKSIDDDENLKLDTNLFNVFLPISRAAFFISAASINICMSVKTKLKLCLTNKKIRDDDSLATPRWTIRFAIYEEEEARSRRIFNPVRFMHTKEERWKEN